MNEIEQLQAMVEDLKNLLSERDKEMEVLTAQSADYTKQIEDYETKVNELEETNTLKSRKISDLLLNSASVIDRKQEVQETSVEENIKDLDDIIGGL